MKRLAILVIFFAVLGAAAPAQASLKQESFGSPPRGCYTKTQEAIPYKNHTRVTGRAVANCKRDIRQIDNFSWVEMEVPRMNRTTYWDAIGSEDIDQDERYTRGAPNAPLFVGKHRYRTCAIYTFTTDKEVSIVARCSPAVTYTRYMSWERR